MRVCACVLILDDWVVELMRVEDDVVVKSMVIYS